MSDTIRDGKGTGYHAEVKSNNKLATESVVVTRAAYVADAFDDSYLIACGDYISLTTTNTEHALGYLKYEGDGDLHIMSIRTCGTMTNKWKIYKNPTGGTITSGSNASVVNTRFNSQKTLDYTAKYGADGTTFTGGTHVDNLINHTGHSVEQFDGAVILAKNDILLLTCEVEAAQDVCWRIHVFEDAGAVL